MLRLDSVVWQKIDEIRRSLVRISQPSDLSLSVFQATSTIPEASHKQPTPPRSPSSVEVKVHVVAKNTALNDDNERAELDSLIQEVMRKKYKMVVYMYGVLGGENRRQSLEKIQQKFKEQHTQILEDNFRDSDFWRSLSAKASQLRSQLETNSSMTDSLFRKIVDVLYLMRQSVDFVATPTQADMTTSETSGFSSHLACSSDDSSEDSEQTPSTPEKKVSVNFLLLMPSQQMEYLQAIKCAKELAKQVGRDPASLEAIPCVFEKPALQHTRGFTEEQASSSLSNMMSLSSASEVLALSSSDLDAGVSISPPLDSLSSSSESLHHLIKKQMIALGEQIGKGGKQYTDEEIEDIVREKVIEIITQQYGLPRNKASISSLQPLSLTDELQHSRNNEGALIFNSTLSAVSSSSSSYSASGFRSNFFGANREGSPVRSIYENLSSLASTFYDKRSRDDIKPESEDGEQQAKKGSSRPSSACSDDGRSDSSTTSSARVSPFRS